MESKQPPLKQILLCLAIALISGCGHTPVTSIYQLSKFNPITTEVDEFRAAVRLPKAINVQPGGVRLILASEHPSRESVRGEFRLQQVERAPELNVHARPGTHMFTFRIGPADVKRFNLLRERLRLEKTRGAEGRLEVRTDACRTTPIVPDDILVSTFVKSSEMGRFYVPLIVDMNILEGMDRAKAAQQLPQC